MYMHGTFVIQKIFVYFQLCTRELQIHSLCLKHLIFQKLIKYFVGFYRSWALFITKWLSSINGLIDTFCIISYIMLECSYGYYGERCSNKCGQCLNSTACHHVTGTCVNGCEPGYKAPNCTEGITSFYIKQIDEEKHSTVH